MLSNGGIVTKYSQCGMTYLGPAWNMIMARPTLKTIAQALNLAVTTVSRAMKDDPAIRLETRKRVQAKAKEVGYIPDRAGVRLRTGKTNVISVVLPIERNMSNHQARLMASLAERLKGTGYHINTSYYFDKAEALAEVRYLVETGSTDGILINSTEPNDARVEYLLDKAFPFVTHGQTHWCKAHPFFDYDNETFAELAITKLAQQSRRCILAILPPTDAFYTLAMQAGIERGAARSSLQILNCPGVNADSPHLDIESAVVSMLTANPHIDGIFASSPISCMAAVSGLESLGLQVGMEIDVVSREAIPFLKMFRKRVLVAQENVAKAGQFLAQALLQRIDKPELPPMQYLDVPTLDQIK